MYVLTDNLGNYISRNAQNRFILVKRIESAALWDNEEKARNVLEKSLNKSFGRSFVVKPVSDFAIISNDMLKSISEGTIDDRSNSYIDILSRYAARVSDIKNRYISDLDSKRDETNENLSKTDKEISDLYHYIELNDCDLYRAWLCFKALQNRLRQRRQFKDELELLAQMKQCELDSKSIEKLQLRVLNSGEDRHYKLRALDKYDFGDN